MPESPPLHAVVFRVGGVVCALPAGLVREILPSGPATRVPGVATAVEGLVNVRGSLVTVVDAHVLLGQPRAEASDASLLLLDRAGKVAGLTVGPVLDFLEVPKAAVAPREALPGVDPLVVRAVGDFGGRRFVLLDLDALLTPLLGG